MQKIIGSIIVVAVCSVMGFEKSRELQLHLKELEELKKVFILLRSEMQYTRVTFVEMFLKISKKIEGLYRSWLIQLSETLEKHEKGTLQEAWELAILDSLKESRLTIEEKEELCRVGSSLGYPEAIELYLEQLELSIQRTREELKNKNKLYQSMGILCGIFLVIVLL